MDRLSDLPVSIIHHIISLLGTEEACRTTILSKKWAHIWSTGLILDFNPMYFGPKKDGVFVGVLRDNEGIERFVNFIETTMRRYSEKKLSIRKFRLESLIFEHDLAGRIDGWLGIALRNQVEELSLSVIPKGPLSYGLPAILFMSKTLTSIKLFKVRMPYFENMNLISLQSLELLLVDVDERMLHDIIKACPLKILNLDCCTGIRNISIPCCSRLESLSVAQTVPVDGTISVDTSSIHRCTYFGYHKDEPFPVILMSASKKNLRVLSISRVFIIHEFFSKLVSELPSIESMEFYSCTMPMDVKIASQTLTELGIFHCFNLINLVIEAPNLDTFRYTGDLQLSSVISSHNKYNAHFCLTILKLDTGTLVAIKNLISKSKCCCKLLSIFLRPDAPTIQLDKDLLNTIDDGSPCDVQELKLSVKCFTSNFGESSCRGLIDGLLWCCCPDIVCLSDTLEFDKPIIKNLLEILQQKVNYWKHPLKRMEIEADNGSLSSWHFDLRLKLYW